jgi:hypothetical protein
VAYVCVRGLYLYAWLSVGLLLNPGIPLVSSSVAGRWFQQGVPGALHCALHCNQTQRSALVVRQLQTTAVDLRDTANTTPRPQRSLCVCADAVQGGAGSGQMWSAWCVAPFGRRLEAGRGKARGCVRTSPHRLTISIDCRVSLTILDILYDSID